MACHPIPQVSASTVQQPVLASGGGNIRQESAATIIRHVSHFLAHFQGRWLREWGVQALSRGGISMGTPWQKTSGYRIQCRFVSCSPFPPSTKGVIRRPGLAGPIWHRAYWNDWSTRYLSFSEFTCRASRSGLGGNFRASQRRGEPLQLGDPHHQLALTAGPASRPRIVCPFKTNRP